MDGRWQIDRQLKAAPDPLIPIVTRVSTAATSILRTWEFRFRCWPVAAGETAPSFPVRAPRFSWMREFPVARLSNACGPGRRSAHPFRHSDYPRTLRPRLWAGRAGQKISGAGFHDGATHQAWARALRDDAGELPQLARLEIFSAGHSFEIGDIDDSLRSPFRTMPPIRSE